MPGKEQAAVKKAENQQRLSAKKRQKSFEMRMENVFYETLTPKSRANHLTAFKITIQPFMEHQMVAYHHPGEEFLYVLSGELELNVSRRIQRLGAHQCFQFDSAKAHRLKSISSEPTVVLVVIYAP
jgi:mannose-6-phosphate isomerase-like protein (cupin superfamily)